MPLGERRGHSKFSHTEERSLATHTLHGTHRAPQDIPFKDSGKSHQELTFAVAF